jgi:hypothetical protein
MVLQSMPTRYSEPMQGTRISLSPNEIAHHKGLKVLEVFEVFVVHFFSGPVLASRIGEPWNAKRFKVASPAGISYSRKLGRQSLVPPEDIGEAGRIL